MADVFHTAQSDSHSTRCLLPLLQPVRHCLHAFLSTVDALRLMRASRSITAALLSGYAFVDHVFTFQSHTAADIRRCIALYARYDMRILRMVLPRHWNEPLVDVVSVLPRSLVCLAVGSAAEAADLRRSAAYAPLDGGVDSDSEELVAQPVVDARFPRDRQSERDGAEGEFYRLIHPVDASEVNETAWRVWHFAPIFSEFNQPISPGALPHGLRYLQLNEEFNQPLQAGSMPDTVEVLQFGDRFHQPLDMGHLPASLTHLIFDGGFKQLSPGVLPAGLQRLHLGGVLAPLQPGALPPQLQQLSFGHADTQPLLPGAIPSSVTHLKLSLSFNSPLLPGCIPHGVEHLNLGYSFNQPLLPGVLPTTLRELVISRHYKQSLQPGSLPNGLTVLAFHDDARFQQKLRPGLIPSSVIALSLASTYKQQLMAGGIPASVRWLRLSGRYATRDLSSVLSPSTRVVWSYY